ncbi:MULTISPECIES: DUF2766 family protein [Edwardsiella]|uniref:DUF2766 domain-containing protein n=2 Tax=Edwardsiella anguillarum TaxID=1821960 RepID=A0A076LTG6_9GAMM|nr:MULTISPECIES: DUF2766 family protein [Edwardsiella]AKM47995.1 hypothetical protein QY76_12260 [Edwardsiella sp. EA181011]GAJ68438.1 protein YecJ [Edwardsiella piscicida]AIJ09962.1 Hypothetical protein ETEE_3541 [Edwardsiella anguillarum ET080813]AKR77612.1 DUF2766 domain-containing protein [Edwardsiella sp. LADL05-105]KAB0588264.1 DUF2766 family protein [Edwardsiella anguillarum]
MSQMLSERDELASDLVACQLVIKQILDVIELIASAEVRAKMAQQLKSIDFNQRDIDEVTRRGVQKAIALIELKFSREAESAAH